MTIAPTLQKYLADHEVAYDLVSHRSTESSLRTAEASHIPGNRLVKGVVVRDKESYWLAVLPASRHVRLTELRTELGQDVELATEQEIEQVFGDCDRGAVPPSEPATALMRLSTTALISNRRSIWRAATTPRWFI